MSGISICISTRNNLEYLKVCLRGLKKYSSLDNEILIHVDGSEDGTVEWLEDKGYEFTYSDWKGACHGWNTAAERATRDYLNIFSDDMFPAPLYDLNLKRRCREDRVISPRLVEPRKGSYPPPYDCGRAPETFDEEKFVEYARSISEPKLRVHAFGAFTLSVKRFRDIGGFDAKVSPFFFIDTDIILTLSEKYSNIKFYEVLDAIAYHFVRGATRKIPENTRKEMSKLALQRFEEKWGFTVGETCIRLGRKYKFNGHYVDKIDFTDFKRKVWTMTDGEFYRAYDEAFRQIGFFDYTLTNLDYFKDWLKGDLLEVGCASGQTLKAVKPFCGRCVGVDVSKYSIEKAKTLNVKVLWADAEKRLPFQDKEWETVLIGHTLEHMRNPERAVEEIKRVCRDRVIVLIPLQDESQRWKKTNMHIQFWPTIESFEEFWGSKSSKSIVARDGTLAIMLFTLGGGEQDG